MLIQKIHVCQTMVRVAIKFVIKVAESVMSARQDDPHPLSNPRHLADPFAFSGFIS
ncbi:unnamed protein product [Lupinus luteus]|uniref:Uncharacterized protein n=1 Tax=Lupinus luteus TaxID=3873 RepID=A0AAV1WWZ0_LUPLU